MSERAEFSITHNETLIDNGEVVVSCYGELHEDSNFDVVCEDEEFDDIWCNANPEGGSFTTWAEVVRVLQNFYDSPIVQIESC